MLKHKKENTVYLKTNTIGSAYNKYINNNNMEYIINIIIKITNTNTFSKKNVYKQLN